MAKKTAENKKEVKIDLVKSNDIVQIDYEGKLDDGTVFDKSKGRAPIAFKVGAGQVISGFEKAVIGMKKGEEKTFNVLSDEAYGPIRKEMVHEFPKSQLPPKPEPQIGMILTLQDPTGRRLFAKIMKINDDKVTLDLNHPLAGKNLTFHIKVVGINEVNSEEECGCGGCSSDDEEEDGCGENCHSCGGCGH